MTFLMVFLIQHTQNRDTAALQLKLDELIRAVNGARNEFLSAEEMEDKDFETLKNEFPNLAAIARQKEPPANSRRGSSPEQASATV